MGNISVKWSAGVPSPSGDGKVSLLTDPIKIDDMTVDKFLDAAEKCTKTRPKAGHESKYECKVLSNGGLFVTQTYWIPGAPEMKVHSVTFVDRAQGLVRIDVYMSDGTLLPRNHSFTINMKPLLNPFRIEAWVDATGNRNASDLTGAFVADLLGRLSLKGDVLPEQPSLTAPGQFSVLTSALAEDTVTAQNWLEKAQKIFEKRGAKQQSAGVYTFADKSWFLPTTYTELKFDVANNQIVSRDFGQDKTMSPASVRSVSYMKTHTGPFRLETWTEAVPGRKAGPPEVESVSEIVGNYLKYGL